MFLGTTTATIIKDGILSIIIVFSEIAFRWMPATLAVITGSDAPGASPVVDDLIDGLSSGRTQTPPVESGVVVDGTYYGADGVSQPIAQGEVQYGEVAADAASGGFFAETFATAWGIFAPISIFISLIIATAIVYSLIRYMQVRAAENRAMALAEGGAVMPGVTAVPSVRVGGIGLPGSDVEMTAAPTRTALAAERRWARIQEQVATEDENDWRLAILDADIMLDEVLESVGYPGETLGEKLKAARGGAGGRFDSLDSAWNAHLVRNHLAHRGSGYQLTHREAKRVIAEYGQVFREFGLLS